MARFNLIITQSANRVKTITLNRPEKRNALSPELIEELIAALDEAKSCNCGVVILTGAGSACCAHSAISPSRSSPPSTARPSPTA
jgi:methylglutaconyl-CoA hydratase